MTLPTPSLSAGWLRQLRVRAGLSQETLADLSGVSERTIRGLEAGAIRAPQRATLRRLAAHLALRADQLPSFLDTWRAEGSRPVDLVGLLDGDIVARRWDEEFRRQSERVRDIAVSQRVFIGPDRLTDAIVTRRTVRVLTDDVDRHLWVQGFDSAATDPGALSASETDNCRLGLGVVAGEGIKVFEFLFDQQLAAGSTYTFDYRIDFRSAYRGGDARPEPETESLIGVASVGPALFMQVEFAPSCRPDSIWQIEQPTITGDFAPKQQLQLSAFDIAQIAVENPGPGAHGIRWAWPDAGPG